MELESYISYTTIKGDTFDILALDFYNDEYMANVIINANPANADIIVFDSGINLFIPIINKAVTQTLPPWKR